MSAYEMRISVWSSDVCSSDLAEVVPGCRAWPWRRLVLKKATPSKSLASARRPLAPSPLTRKMRGWTFSVSMDCSVLTPGWDLEIRSEEHTSELQSLMRISYAVFCLKKKKPNTYKQRKQRHQTNKYNAQLYNQS